MWINLAVAASNIAVIIPLIAAWFRGDYTAAAIAGSAGAASTIIHLTEIKHGLPGVFGQNWAGFWPNVDRICAITAVAWGLYQCANMNSYWLRWLVRILPVAVVGSIAGVLSEHVFTTADTQLLFAVTHILWHISAYLVLAAIIAAK